MNRLLITISIVLIVAFTACTKARGPANGISIQPNNHLDSLVSFYTLINRLGWQADSSFAYLAQQAGNDSGYVNLLLTASGNNNGKINTITFSIFNYTGVGTYSINPAAVSATYYIGNVRHYATSGAITFTSNTVYGLIGTFNFIADTFSVTNGVFNVAQP